MDWTSRAERPLLHRVDIGGEVICMWRELAWLEHFQHRFGVMEIRFDVGSELLQPVVQPLALFAHKGPDRSNNQSQFHRYFVNLGRHPKAHQLGRISGRCS